MKKSLSAHQLESREAEIHICADLLFYVFFMSKENQKLLVLLGSKIVYFRL